MLKKRRQLFVFWGQNAIFVIVQPHCYEQITICPPSRGSFCPFLCPAGRRSQVPGNRRVPRRSGGKLRTRTASGRGCVPEPRLAAGRFAVFQFRLQSDSPAADGRHRFRHAGQLAGDLAQRRAHRPPGERLPDRPEPGRRGLQRRTDDLGHPVPRLQHRNGQGAHCSLRLRYSPGQGDRPGADPGRRLAETGQRDRPADRRRSGRE